MDGNRNSRKRSATTRKTRVATPISASFLHVGFKVAAQMGDRYLAALKQFEPVIAQNVTTNTFDRHLKPIFVG